MNLKLLRNRNFAILIFGNVISLIGSNMQQFALSLYVLSVTKSATLFSSMVAISILPRLLFSPIAGVFGDWFDRKRSIVTLNILNGILVLGFGGILFIKGELSILQVYSMIILMEIVEIFYGTSMAAVTPSIVDKADIFDANTMKSIISSLGNMLSPMLAAVLYGAFGLLPILIVNGISFVVCGITQILMQIPKTNKIPSKINFKAFFQDFYEGIDIIKSYASIKVIIGLGMVLNFCLAPIFSVGLTLLVRETLGSSDYQFGLYGTLMSLSMLMGPMFLAPLAKKLPVGQLTITAFTFVAMLVSCIGIIPIIWETGLFATNWIPFILLILILFAIGMVVGLCNIAIGTLFDTLVPKTHMGRTASVMNLGLMVAIPVGQVAVGFAFDRIHPAPIFVSAALIVFMAILYFKRPLIEATKHDTMVSGDSIVQEA